MTRTAKHDILFIQSYAESESESESETLYLAHWPTEINAYMN